jgi:type I restriction enzyme R subunit
MKRSESEEVKLSEIIEILNERFGTDFKKADQLAIDSVAEELKADAIVQQHASVNSLDNFALAVKGKSRAPSSTGWTRTPTSPPGS